jgi:hypothetical protein
MGNCEQLSRGNCQLTKGTGGGELPVEVEHGFDQAHHLVVMGLVGGVVEVGFGDLV